MIIDGHVHMGSSWLGWQKNEIEMEKLLEIYDTLGVDMGVLNAWQIFYDIEAGNREAYELVKKYPQRLVGFGIISPRDRDRACAEVKKCVEAYGFKGLKFHPSINEYMIDSSLVDPVMEITSKYSLPILIHSENDGYSHPRMIGDLAERHPSCSLIIGHMGGHAWLEAVEMAKKHKNVYLDTTDMLNEVYILPTAIEVAGANKILWGSDAPVLNTAVEMAKIKTADLYGKVTQTDKEMILGKNMARLLNIE